MRFLNISKTFILMASFIAPMALANSIHGPLAEQILQSKQLYKEYVIRSNAKGVKPDPDYQTNFLKRINDELIQAENNERLKQLYFEQLGRRTLNSEKVNELPSGVNQ